MPLALQSEPAAFWKTPTAPPGARGWGPPGGRKGRPKREAGSIGRRSRSPAGAAAPRPGWARGRLVVFLPHWSCRGHCNSSQGAEAHGPAALHVPFCSLWAHAGVGHPWAALQRARRGWCWHPIAPWCWHPRAARCSVLKAFRPTWGWGDAELGAQGLPFPATSLLQPSVGWAQPGWARKPFGVQGGDAVSPRNSPIAPMSLPRGAACGLERRVKQPGDSKGARGQAAMALQEHPKSRSPPQHGGDLLEQGRGTAVARTPRELPAPLCPRPLAVGPRSAGLPWQVAARPHGATPVAVTRASAAQAAYPHLETPNPLPRVRPRRRPRSLPAARPGAGGEQSRSSDLLSEPQTTPHPTAHPNASRGQQDRAQASQTPGWFWGPG